MELTEEITNEANGKRLSMKLSVIIVNYNVKYYVDQCIRSVLRALPPVMPAEIIVVDNHSGDGSVEYLSARYPKAEYPMLRIISSERNLGFARANNIAIRQSKGEYVLLLNPDTIVGEHVLEESIRFMDAHQDGGALGVKMLGVEGNAAMESRRGLPSPLVAFYKMMGFCRRWPKSRVFGHYYMGYLPWDEPAQIEVVSGAYCLLRKAALDKVGLLDEDFFMYGEDIDLSYRVLKGGYHNYYLPVSILHYKGESTEKSSFRYVHVFYEAMLIFFRKHYSGMSLFFSFPIKVAIYAKASVALMGMMSERVRKSLGFFVKGDVRPQRFVFVGTQGMLDACREIADKFCLEAEYVKLGAEESGAEGSMTESLGADCLEDLKVEAEPDKLCNVVFDADAISYEAMLDWMQRNPRKLVQLGTYCQALGKIIVCRDVLG